MSERLASLSRLAVARVRPWWNRLVGWMEYQVDEPVSNRRAAEIVIGGAGIALAGMFLVIAMISLLVRAAIAAGHTAGQLPSTALGRVVGDALQHWIAAHTTGIAVSPATVLTVWAAGGGVLALAGVAGSRGARVLWPVYGAATVAMAWFGATSPHQPIAAGLVGLAWAVVSIVVLHRGGTRTPVPHITVNTRS